MVFHPTRCPQLLDWPFNLLQAVSGLRWVSFVIRDDAKKPWLPHWIHKLLGKFDSPACLALWRPNALGCSWSSWGTVLLCYYRVVVIASKLVCLAWWTFNSCFLVSEFAEFWPWFLSESWAASLHSQKCLLTIQGSFSRYVCVGPCNVFTFII